MARSMMLQELAELCRAMPEGAVPSDYQRAIEQENVLGKPTFVSIRQNRMLLDEPNPLDPVCKTLTEALRKSLHAAHALHEQTLQKEVKHLESQSVWSGLSPEKTATLLQSAGAISHDTPITGTDAELLVSL